MPTQSCCQLAGIAPLPTARDRGADVPATAGPATMASPAITSATARPNPTLPGRTGTSSSDDSGEVDEDVLRLREQVERGHPELAPDPRHLVAAERRLDVDRAVRV